MLCRGRASLIVSASTLGLLAVSSAAFAQGAAPAGASAAAAGEVEEVVVTARMRSETLQNAPVAVTAFSAQKLSDARVQGVADFINLTPNVSIVQSQSAGTSFITIRGISQVRNGESPVAVVVDGVQQVTSRQFTQDLFDVQQIEVLRGPQGALYGRDAIGGAILITTKQPTNYFSGTGEASIGNGEDYRIETAVSGPIIKDKLQFRLTGVFHDFGGLIKDNFIDQTVDATKERAARLRLMAYPTDRLTVDFRAGVDYTLGAGGYFNYQPAKLDPNSRGGCMLDLSDPFGGPAPNADSVKRTVCPNNRGYNYRDIEDTSLKLDYRLDHATITNILAAAHIGEELDVDQFPYTGSRNVLGTDGTQTQWENTSAWSDELRVTSRSDQRFRWMIGAYYLSTRRYISTTTGFDEGLGILPVHRSLNGPETINPTLSFMADDNKNESYALFGNIDYDITSRLQGSMAYRYDWQKLNDYVEPINTTALPAGCTAATTASCNQHRDFSQGQPKFTLNYKVNSNLNLFTDWGIGFRTGQFNQSGAAEAASLPGLYDIVRPEVAKTFEAGVKSQWLDNRLRVNATFFNTQDKNPFYFLFVGSIGAQVLVNIDQVHLIGGELEAQATPLPGLDVFANYGFTHSSIDKYSFNPADQGRWAPYIPLDSWQIGAQYRRPITDSLGLFTRFDVEHHGKQYWDPENDTARSAFELVNLRAGIENARQHWSVVAYVKNLGDKAYNAEFVQGGFVVPAEPRQFGVDFRRDF